MKLRALLPFAVIMMSMAFHSRLLACVQIAASWLLLWVYYRRGYYD